MSTKSTDLNEVGDKFLFCREKGHQWRHVNDELTAGARRLVREAKRQWLCVTCKTEMVETVEIPSFRIVKRKYDYPDGYLFDVPAMGGRLLRHDIRREQFSRSGIRF